VLYSYYVGGELRRPGRTYLYASSISIGILVVVWVGVWALLRHTAGLNFMQAQQTSGRPLGDPGEDLLAQLPGGRTWLRPGAPVTDQQDPVGTAVPFAEIAVNLAFVAVTTRVLFAQAFDRLLPVSVAKVSERNQSPWVAIIIVLIVAIGFCFLEVYVNLSNIVALESLFFALVPACRRHRRDVPADHPRGPDTTRRGDRRQANRRAPDDQP